MNLFTLIDYAMMRRKAYGVSRSRLLDMLKATSDELDRLDKLKNPVTADSCDYCYTAGCNNAIEREFMMELSEKAKQAAGLC